jgi:hypothetical protein
MTFPEAGFPFSGDMPPPLAGAFFLSVEKAKTSGPAKALADNADADNGERRFHCGLYRLATVPRQAISGKRRRRDIPFAVSPRSQKPAL